MIMNKNLNVEFIDSVMEQMLELGEKIERFRFHSSEVFLHTTAYQKITNHVQAWALAKHYNGTSLGDVGIGAQKGYLLAGFQLGYCVARAELEKDIIPKEWIEL
jgi:hypothetical protein